jgi:WD40 repeat protein
MFLFLWVPAILPSPRIISNRFGLYPQYIAVTSHGIYVYDAKNWQEVKYIPIPTEAAISEIDISSDGHIFAAGDIAGNVTFWTTKTWDILHSINVYKGQITRLKISPDGINFVAVGDNKVISVWDLHNGTLINLKESKGNVGSINYSADGQWILNLEESSYGYLKIRKASNLEIINSLNGFREHFNRNYPTYPTYPNYAVSPFTNLVVLLHDGKLFITNLDNDKILATLPVEYSWFEDITHWVFLDKSQLVVKGDRSDFFYLVNLQTLDLRKISADELSVIAGGNPRAFILTKEREIQEIGFEPIMRYTPELITPNGKNLILKDWSYDYMMGIRNIGSMELQQENSMVKPSQIEEGNVTYFTMKNENLIVIKYGRGKEHLNISEIGLNDMRVISETQFKYDVNDTIEAVALSPDGSLLATGTVDGTLSLWNTSSKTQITSFQAHKTISQRSTADYQAIWSIVFSPDGSSVATHGVDQTIKVWNIKDGKEITSIFAEGGEMTFSPNSKYLAYTGENSIHIKALYENTPEIVLNGDKPKYYFYSLQFSSDGSMLASGYGGRLKIWSVTNQSLLADIPELGEGVGAVTFNPDDTLLYIATRDGIVSVWGHIAK